MDCSQQLEMAPHGTLNANARRSNPECSWPKRVATAIAAAMMVIAALGLQAHADDTAPATRPSGELARQIQLELDHESSHERLWWNSWRLLRAA